MEKISENRYTLLSILTSLLIVLSVIGGLPAFYSRLIYLAYAIGAVFIIILIERFDFSFLPFLLFLPITVLVAKPDPVFRSWERLALFAIMFLMSSSLIQSYRARVFRLQLLNYLIYFCIIISVVSFFCYFFNINLFEDRYYGGYLSDYEEVAGHFSGIAKHSMVLGPVAGLSAIFLFNSFIKNRGIVRLFLLSICFASLLFSASRGALLATIGGLVASSYLNRSITFRSSRVVLFLILMAILAFPLYKPYLASVFNKHENVDNGFFDTRSTKIEARLSEFKSSPIVGVGFSAITPDGKDEYNFITGTIEPGSSWLALLSMTGIVGFTLFLVFYVKCYKYSISSNNPLLFALLVFFSIHMLVEGYVFSSGNAISCILWLTLGCCFDQYYSES